MNELIGIRSFNHLNIDDLKKDLLIFDKIFIVGLSEWKEVFEQQLFKNTMLGEIFCFIHREIALFFFFDQYPREQVA